jgi:hypothetical protein
VLDEMADAGVNHLMFDILPGMEATRDCYAEFLAGTIAKWNGAGGAYGCLYTASLNDNSDPNSFALPATACPAAAGTGLPASPAACSNWTGFQWTMLDTHMNTTIVPMRQRLIARGDRLWFRLQYLDYGGSTTGFQQKGAEYGELMLAAFIHLNARFGFVPDEIAITNEGTTWSPHPFSPQDFADATYYTKQRLASYGWSPAVSVDSGQWLGGPTYYPNTLETFDAMTALTGNGGASWSDIWSTGYLTDLDSHLYGSTGSMANLQGLASRGAQYNLRPNIDEYNGFDWSTVVDTMLYGNVASLGCGAMVGPGTCSSGPSCGLCLGIVASPFSYNVTTGASFVRMRQIFSHWKIGGRRVFVSSTNANLCPMAIVNPNGSPVVVVRAGPNCQGGAGNVFGAMSFNVVGLPPGRYHQTWSTTTETDVSGPDFTVPTDGTFVHVAMTSGQGNATIYRDDAVIPTPTQTPIP